MAFNAMKGVEEVPRSVLGALMRPAHAAEQRSCVRKLRRRSAPRSGARAPRHKAAKAAAGAAGDASDSESESDSEEGTGSEQS